MAADSEIKIKSTKKGKYIIFRQSKNGLHISIHDRHLHLKDREGFHEDFEKLNVEKEREILWHIALKHPEFNLPTDCSCKVCVGLKKAQLPFNTLSFNIGITVEFLKLKQENEKLYFQLINYLRQLINTRTHKKKI